MKNKLIATIIYLVVSTLVSLASYYIIYKVWYLDSLVVATGIDQIAVIFLSINTLLGPFLCFVVYKKDKKSLKSDILIIILLNILLFVIGFYYINQARPAWILQIENRFLLISPNMALDKNNNKLSLLSEDIHWSQPKFVSTAFSEDPKVRSQQIDEDLMGKGISFQPRSFSAFNPKQAIKNSKPLEDLHQYNSVKTVNNLKLQYPKATAWIPLRGYYNAKDLVVLLDSQGHIEAISELKPW